MPRKNSYLTITDQFCGAGGSSQGARAVSRRVKGLEVKLALNHWKLAIETHNTNFPDTLHDCTDVSACDPRRYPSTDILITSPECTNHSLAKGQKRATSQIELFNTGKLDPAADRSRATMWDVPRFAEYHNYRIIIVENVVDARKWVMFDAWLTAMHALGYMHKCVYLNSMFCHPTPQSRDRMYVVFWKKGQRAPELEFTPPSWCPKCEKEIYAVQTWKKSDQRYGVYGKRGQYIYCCAECQSIVQPYYYAAFNCIDWSDIGKRIGDRKKPLSPNTQRRIQFGLDKYGAEPMMVVNYNPGHSRPVVQHCSTVTADDHHALATPFLIKQEHHKSNNISRATDGWPTQTTRQSMAMVTPFIIAQGHGHADDSGKVRHPASSLQTQTARQDMGLVSPPFLIEMHRTGTGRKITDPINTATAGAVKTGLITSESWNAFIHYNRSQDPSHITDPVQTVATVEQLSVISHQKPRIEDCFYRMLKPAEIKLAMAFDHDYIVLGSGKDQVKQLGNAVTPPAMEFLIERCIESLK